MSRKKIRPSVNYAKDRLGQLFLSEKAVFFQEDPVGSTVRYKMIDFKVMWRYWLMLSDTGLLKVVVLGTWW